MYPYFLVMEQSIYQMSLCKLLDPAKENIIDLQAIFFDPVSTIGLIVKSKHHIYQETLLIPKSFKVSMKYFSLERSYHFPEFIQWSMSNYAKSDRALMNCDGSKFLCRVNPQSIKETLHVPETNIIDIEQFSEVECIRSFRETSQEGRSQFLNHRI
jgi:glutamine cyclotransferase